MMAWAFVNGLISDPEPLWGCDDATIMLGQGGFEVDNANVGELLYELGLRDGDIIRKINEIDIDTYQDVGYVFTELWVNDNETSFTIEVERNSTLIELNYYLAPSL
jgi:hypothetical protein